MSYFIPLIFEVEMTFLRILWQFEEEITFIHDGSGKKKLHTIYLMHVQYIHWYDKIH